MYTGQQKGQMIRECQDEIAMIQNGRDTAQRHIKSYCRARTRYLEWKMNRIEKNKSFEDDHIPRTKSPERFTR